MASPEQQPPPLDPAAEEEQARSLAERYRYPFVDLNAVHIDAELFRSIPVELMFRYSFVPVDARNGALEIAIADPRQLPALDEISLLLGKKIRVRVATLTQINDLLKKTEQSQRVLEEVTEDFILDVVRDDGADETLSIEKLTGDDDISPVIRLVDTTIFNALERRASDIHIETRNAEVAIKYRIDGVLHYAMPPISKDWHQTIISRIKVMSELDIAENRVPQDGRFRVRYKGRQIDFRVSIMPTVHGEDAVLRVLDKESMSEKFKQLSLDVVGFSDRTILRTSAAISTNPTAWCWSPDRPAAAKRQRSTRALSEIKTDEDKIVTIEDPVEYPVARNHPNSGPRKEGADVRARLALDPAPRPGQDHVGEIRDSDTAQIAIQSGADRALGFYDRSRQQRR